MHDDIVFSIFLIFTGAAVLAGAALLARQSMLVAYIALGVIAGPGVLGLVDDPDTIRGIGHVGIIFLLFLLGLNLHPQKLAKLLREALLVTVASSAAFALAGAGVAWAFGFSALECALIGAVMTFSSTILGLKLLPTTALHHRHSGEIVISILLLQDVLAILILLVVDALGREHLPWTEGFLIVVSLPALAAVAFALERWVLVPLITRLDTIREYVFLAAVGWCLGVAQLGAALGLSYEIGGFVAGVVLAESPISNFIAESLKPLRDFFLIMFFFSIGAAFELSTLPHVALPAAVLAALMLLLKPSVFRALLVWEREAPALGAEIGVRLGQISEFALLIAVLALENGVMGERASSLVQAATILTFVVSSYVIVIRYPTPIAVNPSLRRD